MKCERNTTEVVDIISLMHFKGNIVPNSWYKHIISESGNPDLLAILTLAEIIDWYRSSESSVDGDSVKYVYKKFKGDKLQKNSREFADKFGVSKRRAQLALKRLKDLKLITVEYRSITVNGMLLPNIAFIEPIPSNILRISMPSKCPN